MGRAADPAGPESVVPAARLRLDLSDAQALASVRWLSSVALARLPRTIDGDKDWGRTKRVWAGVKVRFDDGQLKTKRRFRQREHGRWVQYKLDLPPAESPQAVSIRIHDVSFHENTDTDQRRWKVDATIVAPLKFKARIQRWNLGTRLFSVSVEGRMRLRLKSTAWFGFDTDYGEIPPALVFDPTVQRAALKVESFEVDRVSHVGGDVAEAWGEVVQEVIVETYVDQLNDKLVSKLNRAIEKEQEDLRISTAEWFRWGQSSDN